MRILIVLVFILITGLSHAQDLAKQKAVIDTAVKDITAISLNDATRFTIQANKKVLHYISYRYMEKPEGYITIQRQFSKNKDTIQQYFYMKNGELIYAIENITSFYGGNQKDNIVFWSGQFYFSKNKLIDHVTLGHGKSELETWNPEQEMLTAFKESKQDVERFKKGN